MKKWVVFLMLTLPTVAFAAEKPAVPPAPAVTLTAEQKKANDEFVEKQKKRIAELQQEAKQWDSIFLQSVEMQNKAKASYTMIVGAMNELQRQIDELVNPKPPVEEPEKSEEPKKEEKKK